MFFIIFTLLVTNAITLTYISIDYIEFSLSYLFIPFVNYVYKLKNKKRFLELKVYEKKLDNEESNINLSNNFDNDFFNKFDNDNYNDLPDLINIEKKFNNELNNLDFFTKELEERLYEKNRIDDETIYNDLINKYGKTIFTKEINLEELDLFTQELENRLKSQKIKNNSDTNLEVEDTEVEDTELEDTELEDTELEDTEVEDNELEDTELEDTELEDTELEDTELEDTELEDTELEDTELETETSDSTL